MWQADLDAGRRSDGLTTEKREEIRRLRRENRQLRQEREILAKAAAVVGPAIVLHFRMESEDVRHLALLLCLRLQFV